MELGTGVRAQYREVECEPAPDALSPCEDLLGQPVFRAVSWLMTLAALAGNATVLAGSDRTRSLHPPVAMWARRLVLGVSASGAQRNRRVHLFLMANLAFADLLLGIVSGCVCDGWSALVPHLLDLEYMLMLSWEDGLTMGRYYNYAVDWQTGTDLHLL